MNYRLWRVLVALFVAFLFCLALAIGVSGRQMSDTAASPLYVRTDGHDTNCDGTADVAYSAPVSPTCAYATIQKGVGMVDPGGTIIVRVGVYTENVSIGKNLTLQGDGADTTIVDGGGSGRTFSVSSGGLTVTVSGVTMRNGRSGADGGGIYIPSYCTVALVGCTIINNTADSGGGGVWSNQFGSTVISNCTIISNTAAGGGGIASHTGALSVISSTVSNNTATTSKGGGIWKAGDATSGLTITNSTLEGNDAYLDGGGVFQINGPLSIENSTFISNTTDYGCGGVQHTNGAVTISGSTFLSNTGRTGGGIGAGGGTLIINSTTLRWNQASLHGGGVYNVGVATLANVAVAENTANSQGGGIYSGDTMTLTNVTVSGNSAQYGGGIWNWYAVTLTVLNSTIVSNTISDPTSAGGIDTNGPVVIRNSILAHNDDANCYIESDGSLTSTGHNLEYGDSCGFTHTHDITGTNPLLGPLTADSGTLVHPLLKNSPAINKGVCIAGITTDQRGAPRIGPCDIGAYEYVPKIYLPLVLRNA